MLESAERLECGGFSAAFCFWQSDLRLSERDAAGHGENEILGSRLLMIVSRIKEKLTKYPEVTYTASEDFLEIPAQTPTGFRVWIRKNNAGFTVGFEGWHEEFTDDEAALKCFGFGLSTACRLRVFRCLGVDYKWQVLIQVDGEWVADSETGLLIPTLWLPKKQRDLQNEIVFA